ncbi:MAG: molybdenum cofactor guanylyltransferase [Deltaproteobacteria bacterium]|nr:molybdenum cofactor guanylyltransferase [Deltaproteobacteria bacterium]
MAAIILAGGENRRMGRNKAFLPWKGRIFLWYIIGALSPLFREILLVTREPERYAGFPVKVVCDLYPERGPLTGIFSGLSASRDPKNFCVACDMPMVRTELVQYMMRRAGAADALVAVIRGSSREDRPSVPQPLHAVYDQRCLPVMGRHLREGRRGMQGVLRSLNTRFLEEGEMARMDPDLSSFVSINTVEDYQTLIADGAR